MEVIGGVLLGCTDGPTETVPPSSSALLLFELKTGGCSGADGFLRCDVTYSDEITVAPTASTVVPALSR